MNLIVLVMLLRLIFEIPAVDAFIHHTFKLPHVPFELGQRNIHTPEHLGVTHQMTIPLFHLQDTCPPRRVGDYMLVTFNFTTLFGKGRVSMFSNNPSQSNLFLVDSQNNPYFLARLAVQRDDENPRGHILYASGEFLRPSTWLERTLVPVFLNLHSMENWMIWSYQVPNSDHNLRIYRTAILYDRQLEN
jgi:hypothetical protein